MTIFAQILISSTFSSLDKQKYKLSEIIKLEDKLEDGLYGKVPERI